MICGLRSLHAENYVHCNFHGRNTLVCNYFDEYYNSDIVRVSIDFDSCKLENDLILNSDHKNNETYGSIPYIPPEVLRGNKFTIEGDVYSFGGIMYEMVTAQRPFADQAHDTYLMMDICNGVRPKVPDFILNWIPEWYLDLMYRCWSDDPSERPTTYELADLFYDTSVKLYDNIVDDNITRQLKIADENKQNTSKSQKQELFSRLSKLHPQSCYSSRYIHTLHELHYLLEEIKYGKSSDPNLLLKSNESTTSSVSVKTHNIDCKTVIQSWQENESSESTISSVNTHNIDEGAEIQSWQGDESSESTISSDSTHDIDEETEIQGVQENVIRFCIVL
ncbi:hypothetical protein Glove_60g159 [Diversispora epigaea]|uniref:Protein kinase domain-containing protein n=1 Tax=Diversispora epigaea TaxID=1348612 RepID=A0A397JE34_9GLOM|nr:hypothetical protein Glove_60g159 [Diversispora epigaea]